MKQINETIKEEAKEEKRGFLNMLLVKLVKIMLGYILLDRGVILAREGIATNEENV